MKKVRHCKFTDFLIGIIFTLLFLSIAVIITINFRPLYYLDIKILDIETTSGFPRAEILDNYNALIDYCSPFFQGDLNFPTFGASQSGLQHFKEVKDIFTYFYIIAAITLVAAIIIIVYKVRRRSINYLPVAAITAIVIPAITGLLLMINFDKAFIVFHKLFFKNDYWIFDPDTDPVIQILPDTFFLHSALLIIFLVVLASLSTYFIYLLLKKRSGIRYRKLPNIKL
ncbi:MAG TPA: TIGR01906 family membrane protein [Mobilitalea sp.]|nr:TIGR01906 family membrane protein [Mobilitalea sp.]